MKSIGFQAYLGWLAEKTNVFGMGSTHQPIWYMIMGTWIKNVAICDEHLKREPTLYINGEETSEKWGFQAFGHQQKKEGHPLGRWRSLVSRFALVMGIPHDEISDFSGWYPASSTKKWAADRIHGSGIIPTRCYDWAYIQLTIVMTKWLSWL